MRTLILLLAILFTAPAFAAEEIAFSGVGSWRNDRRGTVGPLACTATRSKNDWRARFQGQFMGEAFEYIVAFQGPPEALKGTSTIDGYRYNWQGSIRDGIMTGQFRSIQGNHGSFIIRQARR